MQFAASACNAYKDDGVMIAAASHAIWNKGIACGVYYNIKCSSATNLAPNPCKSSIRVIVRIVDYCPRCAAAINLSLDAFSVIANPDAGVVKIIISDG